MVEIFKTNVNGKKAAGRVLKALHMHLPACTFNFDLEDGDRILRAQSENVALQVNEVIAIVKRHNVEISLFED